MSTIGYRVRTAGGHLPDAVKRPGKRAWYAWGRFSARSFSRYFYTRADMTWNNTNWLGVPLWKNPLDLWVYQEIVWEVKPALIIETGTYRGGSAFYFASLCDLIGNGAVITIDVMGRDNRPQHPRIEYVKASSVADDVIADLEHRCAQADGPVLVVLDSDHHKAHVDKELAAYHSFVTPGSYLIVEDTNINGNPVNPFFGPGPMEAVQEFLPLHPEFEVDAAREKYMVTHNPKGYLRRRP
jgi:cephalosporin hydroxylase